MPKKPSEKIIGRAIIDLHFLSLWKRLRICWSILISGGYVLKSKGQKGIKLEE